MRNMARAKQSASMRPEEVTSESFLWQKVRRRKKRHEKHGKDTKKRAITHKKARKKQYKYVQNLLDVGAVKLGLA